jgi:tetratricopeptide (TPR) repeat protein
VRILVLLAFLAGTAAAHPSPRQTPTAHAQEHFTRGEKLFAVGEFREALAEYQASYDAEEHAELLFNIGQCHRNLKNLDAAIFSYRKYLRLKPDAANRPAVEKLLEDLEDERSRQPKPRIPLLPHPQPPAEPSSAKWWVWGGVGVLAVGAVVATVLLLPSAGVPSSDLGNVDFPQ